MHLDEEGKINENTYLIDAEFFKLPKTLALYVLENEGVRMLVDTGENLTARKIVKKLKAFNLFPVQKILFTHAHWDHIQAYLKLRKLMKVNHVEVLAHENAVEILKDPTEMNEFFGYSVDPIEVDTTLKEGDIIDLKGFKLEVYELFGHTQDSIGLYDIEHRNLIVGDAIIDKIAPDTYVPVLFGPHFDEESLLKTYEKLRNMRDKLDSITFAHFGTYTGEDVDKILDNVEKMYFKARDCIIDGYKKGLSIEEITVKYHDEIIPDSKIFSKEHLKGLEWNISQNIETLKAAGFLK
ncbi:MAG: MBL fold metallo-hydrolase [Promethearchaeota archaeon]|nr:MAG: MBL fold metallo-hydrolase [Candidatus Lokiarchaeota archaeon]